jgi:hypothetical protein
MRGDGVKRRGWGRKEYGHKKAPECVIGGYALRSSSWGKPGVHLGGTGLLDSAYWLVLASASTSNNYFRFTFSALNSAPVTACRRSRLVLVGWHPVGNNQDGAALVVNQPGANCTVQGFREPMGETPL